MILLTISTVGISTALSTIKVTIQRRKVKRLFRVLFGKKGIKYQKYPSHLVKNPSNSLRHMQLWMFSQKNSTLKMRICTNLSNIYNVTSLRAFNNSSN